MVLCSLKSDIVNDTEYSKKKKKLWTTSDSTWFVSAVPQLNEITVVVSVHLYYHLIDNNVSKCYGSVESSIQINFASKPIFASGVSWESVSP